MSSAIAAPFDLDPNRLYNSPPRLESFRFISGTVNSGETLYFGKKLQSGFETELHVRFSEGVMNSALVILGPEGIGAHTCFRRYRSIVKNLNRKYGHFTFRHTTRDPIADDLVMTSKCSQVRIGLVDVLHVWKKKNVTIVSKLLGDSEGFYIEIEYVFVGQKTIKKKIDL